MKYKKFNPILLNKKNILNLNADIVNYLYDVLYKPLVNIYNDQFKQNIRLNEVNNRIKAAFRQGRLYFKEGKIYGDFKDARLVKELQKLGRYNKNGKYFEVESLPHELWEINTNNKIKIKDVEKYIDSFLNDFVENIDKSINFMGLSYNDTISNYNKQFTVNLTSLGITPALTEKETQLLNKNYINNTKYDIKNMALNNIQSLRTKMKDLVLKDGANNREIAKILMNNYNLTQKRALFIARQESNLLLAEYSKNNYIKTGIRKFEWQTAGDEKVRDYPWNNKNGQNHKYLDGQVFKFDDPPVINQITGEKGLPGQAYNCRCVMCPIVE
mgnify:CR=1 FL=1